MRNENDRGSTADGIALASSDSVPDGAGKDRLETWSSHGDCRKMWCQPPGGQPLSEELL